MKQLFRKQSTINILLTLLMISMLTMQFIPFWQTGETSCSLQRMIWFPNDQPVIQNHIEELTGTSFNIDSVVWLTLGTFLCSVLGIIFCLYRPSAFWPSVFPTLGGFMGIWNYLSRPVLQIGALWEIHLLISVIMLLFGAYSLIRGIKVYNQD